MSSSGHIYREDVKVVTSSTSGSSSVQFDIENDGFMAVLERVSGTTAVLAKFYSELPDPMTDLYLGSLSTDDGPVVGYFISGRKARVDLSWSGACEFRIAVKRLSGAAVAAGQTQQSLIALNESMLAEQRLTNIALKNILEQDLRILNNLRQITEIDEDEGELF